MNADASPLYAPLFGHSPETHARVAAVFGLVMLVGGTFANWASTRLLVRDDLATTASNLVANESLLRYSILGSLAMMVAWVFYALFLYRLLRPVDGRPALTMLALVVTSVPIYMLNQTNLFAALPLAKAGQLEQLGVSLEIFRFGNSVATIFFALWLLPLGVLVLRSTFLPKVLGVLLLLGTPGYLIHFAQALLFPSAAPSLWGNPFLVVTHLSELALLLWLLVRGVHPGRWAERARTGTASSAAAAA